jgi:ribosomal protein S18 acetylase RimI-like enzyme
VREAEVGDVAQLSATLADAFATDPILQWLAPSHRSDRRLRRLLAIELEYYMFPAGRVLTTGDFRGANLELPPGRWEMTVPLSAAIGFVRAFGLRLPRARRLQRLFEGIHLQEPHYYIRYLGVATRFQGQGLGTALLRPTLDRCDGEGVPAYLEASTERSAALYNRLGFVHLGELRVPNGPRFWPMRRPPAAAYATRTLVASGMERASRSEA